MSTDFPVEPISQNNASKSNSARQSLFLTVEQRDGFLQLCASNTLASDHRSALLRRVDARASSPSLSGPDTTTEWWHHAAEYVSDAAIAHALAPGRNKHVEAWLRSQTLALARRPLADWVGPFFRDHRANPPRGHLETAHLVWAVAAALDLASEVFTRDEHEECATRLREGMAMCERWLDAHTHLNNWRAILSSGVAVAGAVLDDGDAMERAEAEYRLCLKMSQDDGSYGESLQYANYAALGLLLTYESLVRRQPALAAELPLISGGQLPRWQAYSHLYRKPLAGWGAAPRPRAANFNDSAAMFRPTADLLLHFAARAKESAPTEAGLARWLFEENYAPPNDDGPHDRATFGFINGLHFPAFSLWPDAAEATSPAEVELPLTHAFANGHAFVRDAWDGQTILAINGGGEPYRVTSHLHRDLNSFILAHNRERLLIDPGHSCYRNAMRSVDIATSSHNTCTFQAEAALDQAADKQVWPYTPPLEQRHTGKVTFDPQTREPSAPVDRGAYRRFIGRQGEVSVVVSDAARAYGEPITEFTRVWIQCGAHALFIVDRITASVPVKTTWNWLLNNRDGALQLKPLPPDRLVARRPNAGMKLFSCHEATLTGPVYGYAHDCYHPLPNQLGEGAPGSGWLMRFVEKQPAPIRLAVHAIIVDRPGAIANWHLKREGDAITLARQHSGDAWTLDVTHGFKRLVLTNFATGERHVVASDDRKWRLAEGA